MNTSLSTPDSLMVASLMTPPDDPSRAIASATAAQEEMRMRLSEDSVCVCVCVCACVCACVHNRHNDKSFQFE